MNIFIQGTYLDFFARTVCGQSQSKLPNFILNKIFPTHKILNKLDFPAIDMFKAKINSIYNIFYFKNFEKLFPKVSNQHVWTIMHFIEICFIFV